LGVVFCEFTSLTIGGNKVSQFKDKVAIVTGGASGIGGAICEELGKRGAIVVVTDINEDGIKEIAEKVSSEGGKGIPKVLDVTQPEDVQKVVDETKEEFGRLDYMFNNAGIGIGGEIYDFKLEDWEKIIDINLYGVIHGVHAAYPLMIKQGFGHIVNTSSLTGLMPIPIKTAYSTTKFAVVGLSRALRSEAEDFGVKVSVICPGFIKTAFYDNAEFANVDNKDKDAFYSKLPGKFMSARGAARATIEGIEKNQDIIVFPLSARILWRLYRISTKIADKIGRTTVGNLRSITKKS